MTTPTNETPREIPNPRPVGISKSVGDNVIVVLDDGAVWEWWPNRGCWERLPPVPGTDEWYAVT